MTIFSPEQLDALVKATLPPAIANHRVAVVGTVDEHGAQVIAGFTSKDHQWEFMGAYRHDWTAGDSVGARVIWQR